MYVQYIFLYVLVSINYLFHPFNNALKDLTQNPLHIIIPLRPI